VAWLAFCASPALSDPPQAEPGPGAAPVENWRTSPWHGVIDGAGRVIPCRCRFRGTEYRLGEMVCMQTPQGTVLTRCDLFMNNTSWIPTEQQCTISGTPAGATVAAR
jgi:hypothetical protein